MWGVFAAVVVPVGVAAWLVSRRTRPNDAPPEPWHAPWGPFEVIAGFFLLNLFVPAFVILLLSNSGFFQTVYGPAFPPAADHPPPPVEASAAVAGVAVADAAHDQLQDRTTTRMLWAGFVALPFQLAVVVVARDRLFPHWRFLDPPRDWPRRVAVAAAAWAVLTPLVLAVHAGVNWAFAELHWAPQAHPLSRLAGKPPLDRALFVFKACVSAPVVEEVVFRGLLLPWLLVSSARTLPVLALCVVYAAWTPFVTHGVAGLTRGPALFAGVLLVVGLLFAAGKGRWGGVFTAAALFAVVHSSVWPTPIPLFVLGVGLGWLAVRTRGLLVPILVHALFNGVSALFVLRGPP